MHTNKSFSTLMELTLVLLFFALSASVILQLFSTAHVLSEESARDADMLVVAQDTVERFYASDLTVKDFLLGDGFVAVDNQFVKQFGGVTLSAHDSSTNALAAFELTALTAQEDMFTLSAARYFLEEAEP